MYKIRVKIKTWEELSSEFKDFDGSKNAIICDDAFFFKDLDNELPEDRIIEVDIREADDVYVGIWNGWAISYDMIKEHF